MHALGCEVHSVAAYLDSVDGGGVHPVGAQLFVEVEQGGVGLLRYGVGDQGVPLVDAVGLVFGIQGAIGLFTATVVGLVGHDQCGAGGAEDPQSLVQLTAEVGRVDGPAPRGGKSGSSACSRTCSTAACYLGWLFQIWDRPKRQTFADKIMHTIVVPASEPPQPP